MMGPKSGDSLIQAYWSELDLDLDFARKIIPLGECWEFSRGKNNQITDSRRRLRLACQAFFYHFERICHYDSVKNRPWLGIEKWEALVFSQKAIPDRKYFQDRFKQCLQDVRSYALGLAMNSFLSVFSDPHTYLVPSRYFREVLIARNKRVNRFALSIRRNRNLNWVVSHLTNPRVIADLKPRIGDRVLTINHMPILDMNPKEVQELFFLNQPIKLALERDGRPFSVTLFPQSEPRSVSVQTKYSSIGVLRVEKFQEKTCLDVERALQGLKNRGISRLVLDLRDNPGGSFTEALCVMDHFLAPKKLMLFTLSLDGTQLSPYYSIHPQLYSGDLLILINDFSASAAEIVAGGLQALGRALVVGRGSFGKGTFQDGVEINAPRGKLLFFETKGYYLFADKKTPQLKGVVPNFELPCSYCDDFLKERDLFLFPIGIPSFMTLVSSTSQARESNPTKLNTVLSSRFRQEQCLGLTKSQTMEEEESDEGLNKALQHFACLGEQKEWGVAGQ
ncbi:MAG: S41 family peptidase [Bdellovibrionaceae bacterium]|nr:S41 family peptidase [Pseudobdellovibrionaceae bacterium]MDW8189929.1 S41 family peptidase [Pseudobdellovibrionaceae bacterium]